MQVRDKLTDVGVRNERPGGCINQGEALRAPKGRRWNVFAFRRLASGPDQRRRNVRVLKGR